MKGKFMYVLNWIISVALIAVTLVGGVKVAESIREEDPAGPPASCSDDALYGAFDFWLGAWDVHTADGKMAGRNHITRVEDGCLILEEWTSAQGGSGQSMNYVDPQSGTWNQLWVDASGTVIRLNGGIEDDAMHLEGTLSARTGAHYLLRGIWTPLDDGRVRQLFEQSTDDGASWSVWFDGYYSLSADTTAQ